MTLDEIQTRLDAMPAAMNAKGLIRPDADFRVRANEGYRAWFHYFKTPASFYADESKIFDGDTPAEIFERMDEWIANLPSPEAARLQQFTEALAGVIELGRANGIDVQFVNPLTEAMKRLSENAITYQAA